MTSLHATRPRRLRVLKPMLKAEPVSAFFIAERTDLLALPAPIVAAAGNGFGEMDVFDTRAVSQVGYAACEF
jgi:hypothetical protein